MLNQNVRTECQSVDGRSGSHILMVEAHLEQEVKIAIREPRVLRKWRVAEKCCLESREYNIKLRIAGRYWTFSF